MAIFEEYGGEKHGVEEYGNDNKEAAAVVVDDDDGCDDDEDGCDEEDVSDNNEHASDDDEDGCDEEDVSDNNEHASKDDEDVDDGDDDDDDDDVAASEEEENNMDFYGDEVDGKGEHVDGDISIELSFYQHTMFQSFGFFSDRTLRDLLDDIRRRLVPSKRPCPIYPTPISLEIKEGAMFIYQGEDLCGKAPNLTLQKLGMVEIAHILILYPGPFTENISPPSKSFQLKSLAESARTNAQAGIGIRNFLQTVNMSSDWQKVIYLEIPVSDGIDLLMPSKVDLTSKVGIQKLSIQSDIQNMCAGPPGQCFWRGFSSIGDFDLLFKGKKLVPWKTFSEYDVEENSKLQLSRKVKFVSVSLPIQIGRSIPTSFTVKSLDNVSKLKIEISLVTGIPTGKQLMKYQNKVLKLDNSPGEKSLLDLGIRFTFHDCFAWASKPSVLEVLPCTPLPNKVNDQDPRSVAYEAVVRSIEKLPCDYTGYYDDGSYDGHSRPLKFRRTMNARSMRGFSFEDFCVTTATAGGLLNLGI